MPAFPYLLESSVISCLIKLTSGLEAKSVDNTWEEYPFSTMKVALLKGLDMMHFISLWDE